MNSRFTTSSARSYSSGTQGRSIANVRTQHYVIDDADYSGGPNEAITAAEAFLSGITACAVLMLERMARERDIPLIWSDISEVHAAYDSVRMRFELTGPSEEQARELVEVYKRR